MLATKWLLGIEPRPSGRVSRALSHWATSPALQPQYWIVSNMTFGNYFWFMHNISQCDYMTIYLIFHVYLGHSKMFSTVNYLQTISSYTYFNTYISINTFIFIGVWIGHWNFISQFHSEIIFPPMDSAVVTFLLLWQNTKKSFKRKHLVGLIDSES